jgi:hypothetical protein
MLRPSTVSPLVALALPLTGCTSVQSAALKTSGISAEMSVVASGDGNATSTVVLHVDTNATDYVDLSSGDSLTVTANAQTRTLGKTTVLGAISYSATLNGGVDAENTQFTIAFNRGASDVSAPASTVSLPKPFTITGPAGTATLSRANDTVTIMLDSGSSDTLTYDVDGSCVTVKNGVSVGNDTGSITIPKGTLVNSAATTTACPVKITVHRNRVGHLDPAFGAGGNITASQARTIAFSSTP